jgi:hypothetical protein
MNLLNKQKSTRTIKNSPNVWRLPMQEWHTTDDEKMNQVSLGISSTLRIPRCLNE